MARWSNPIKLTEVPFHADYLDYPGCYEVGFFRGGEFRALYVGKSKNLYRRLATYLTERSHNPHIRAKVGAARHNLYVCVIRTDNHHRLEGNLQRRHGVGRTGSYAWNRRIEWSQASW
jgi:excinuclease UvrABC nuclease subunit